MIQLMYASLAVGTWNPIDVDYLLASARRNNQRHGITGRLLFHEGCFLGVLEGEAEPVQRLFDRIACDPRHEWVTLLVERPITRRDYPEEALGFQLADERALRTLPGFRDLFGTGVPGELLTSPATLAQRLLHSFHGGAPLGEVPSPAGLDATGGGGSPPDESGD